MLKSRNKLIALSLILLSLCFAVAACSKTKYTVTFDSQGGSAVTAAEVEEGGKVAKPSPDPTKSGFTFAGWFKEEALTTEWKFDTDTVTSNITLYAKWTANAATQFTVTFNSNDGSAVTAASVAPGGKVTKPTDPTKAGYVFAGWFKEAALTTAWNFTTDTVSANTTLYAKWIKLHTVTLEYNNGWDDVILTVQDGNVFAEPEAPAFLGHDFAGWFTADGTGDEWGSEWDFATGITANTTLYAKWIDRFGDGTLYEGIETQTELVAALNDTESDAMYYLKNDIQIVGTLAARSGKFSGIFDGNGHAIIGLTLNAAGAQSLFADLGDGAVVRNIVFLECNVTSTDNYAALICDQVSAVADDDTNITIDNIVVRNSIVKGNNANGVGLLLGRVNRTAGNANITVNISNIVIENSSVTNEKASVGGLIGMIDGVAAVEELVIANITNVYTNGLTVSMTTAANCLGGIIGEIKNNGRAEIDKVVHINLFLNGFVSGTSGTQHIAALVGRITNNAADGNTAQNIYVRDSEFRGRNHINDMASGAGGTSSKAFQTIENAYLVDITRTVLGGDLSSQDKNFATENRITAEDGDTDEEWWLTNLTAIAGSRRWNQVEVGAEDGVYYELIPDEAEIPGLITVTFVLNYTGGGVCAVKNTLEGNTLYSWPAAPERYTHYFAGWYTAAVDGDVKTSADTFDENTVLYAQWTLKPVYTVEFDLLAESIVGAAPADITDAVEGYKIAAPADPVPASATRVFVGWFTQDGTTDWGVRWNFSTDTVDAGDVTSDVLTLYAKFVDLSDIIFDGNGDDDTTSETIQGGEGQFIDVADAPVVAREGFDFDGWWITNSNDGVTFETKWNFASSTIPAGGVTLFARWYEQITVSFIVDETPYATPQQISEITKALKPANPEVPEEILSSVPEAEFLGWFTQDGSGEAWGDEWDFNAFPTEAFVTEVAGDTGEFTLYAKFGVLTTATKTWDKAGTETFFTTTGSVGDFDVAGYAKEVTLKLDNASKNVKFTIPAGAVNISVTMVFAREANGNARVAILGDGEILIFRHVTDKNNPVAITWPTPSGTTIDTSNTTAVGTYSIYTGTGSDAGPATTTPYLTFKAGKEYTIQRDSTTQSLCALIVTYDLS